MHDRWESAVDKAIRESLGDGRIDDLPGKGKPLRLDDEANTPSEQRMAFKLLRDNDMAPDWVLMSRELEADEAALKTRIRNAARRSPKAPEALAAAVEAYNKRVLTFNLKVPRGVDHRRLIDLERAMQQAR